MLEFIFAIVIFVLGMVWANCAGLIAYRFLKCESIATQISYCSHCNKKPRKYDTIPIILWITVKVKCRHCELRAGNLTLLLIEMLGGICFALTCFQHGTNIKSLPLFAALLFLNFLFIMMSLIDYETHSIYNVTMLVFALISTFIFIYKFISCDANLWSHIGGAILGFIFFGSVKIVSKIVLKKDALGMGDVYLVAIAGLMIGAFPLLISIIIAAFLGSIIEIIKIKTNKSRKESEIAFGPYLMLGIFLMAIYGDSFMKFYREIILNAFI